MVKKIWSSTKIPGFMVQMESTLKSENYTLEIKEWVTDFFINQ